MVLTGADSVRLSAGTPYSTVVFTTKSQITATIPTRGLTVQGQRVDALIDMKNKMAHTATLSGGVKGTLTGGKANEVQTGTFTGATVLYTNRADVDKSGSDFDATGGVTFTEALDKQQADVKLTGSHGTFEVRTVAGAIGLSTAAMDGPVTFVATTRKSAKAGEAPSHIGGKGGHLTLKRDGASGTGYEVVLSGDVTYNGSLQGTPLSGTAKSFTIHLDANFQLIDFNASEEAGVATPQGKG
jgi:hypothetical protein